jgi:hypothetical protein
MFCYVIMAHANAPQVLHLVRRIKDMSPSADVLIRHFVPGLIDPEEARAAGAERFRSDLEIVWGDWTMTRAAIEALGQAYDRSDAQYFVLLSGQDYPVRNLADWEQQITEANVDALVDCFPPNPEDWQYSWRMVTPPAWIPRLAWRILMAAWRRIAWVFRKMVLFYEGDRDPRYYFGLRRIRPLPVPVTKAGLWITLSRGALAEMLERDRTDHRLRESFRKVRISDESYLATLATTSPTIRWWDCTTTHARFTFNHFGAQPVTERELDYVATTPAAFVRKMESLDGAVVAKADALAARPPDKVKPVSPCGASQRKLTGADHYAGERDALLATMPEWSPPTS